MTVRLSERRLPATLKPGDLGESLAGEDSRWVLVSFVTSPLVVARDNVYVAFVLDEDLAGRVAVYEWSFTVDGGAADTRRTDIGEITYRPAAAGALQVTVRLLDAGDAEQAALTAAQEIVEPNPELEGLIEAARNEPGPGVGNPDVARELVNDHNPYYQGVVPAVPETSDAFRQLIFGMVADGALRRPPLRRTDHLQRLAAAVNQDEGDFAVLAGEGAGVCGIRLALLAMVVGRSADDPTPLLEWTELPDAAPRRALADEQLRQRLAALEKAQRVDLFTIVRFPKANITHCARIVDTLRDRYFRGASYDDVVNGLSGTRAHWIVRHYREGPLVRV